MGHDIEEQLLRLDDPRPEAVARGPPGVGIEIRVSGASHGHRPAVAFHCPTHDTPQTTGVFRGRDHDNRPTTASSAPAWQHTPLVLAASGCTRYALNRRHPECVQIAYRSLGLVFVGQAPAQELQIHRIGRILEHRDTCRNALACQIGGLEHALAVGFHAYHDGVGTSRRFVHHERPPDKPERRRAQPGHAGHEGNSHKNSQ